MMLCLAAVALCTVPAAPAGAADFPFYTVAQYDTVTAVQHGQATFGYVVYHPVVLTQADAYLDVYRQRGFTQYPVLPLPLFIGTVTPLNAEPCDGPTVFTFSYTWPDVTLGAGTYSWCVRAWDGTSWSSPTYSGSLSVSRPPRR
jgi:hypothetical protein